MLRHGIVQRNMFMTTLIQMPKSTKKKLNDSANYRVIAQGSFLGKIIDIIVMEKRTFNLRLFSLGLHVLSQNTIYFLYGRISLNIIINMIGPLVTLHAYKAFDCAEYCTLFNLLQ
jgi:hypothetical protein